MTLKKYAEIINKLSKKHPYVTVIYSTDNEGTDFKNVIYTPSVGFMMENTFCRDSKNPDIICIN